MTDRTEWLQNLPPAASDALYLFAREVMGMSQQEKSSTVKWLVSLSKDEKAPPAIRHFATGAFQFVGTAIQHADDPNAEGYTAKAARTEELMGQLRSMREDRDSGALLRRIREAAAEAKRQAPEGE